ncbi:hypothetical protein C479_01296 [Halovivax asiaticus JCM 14624]|uniref:Uncharacterized protein n=1 Tax=Halovivax asiaticus JCM 14624 TaxID=1227490 RepID=M0BSR0_9EURY|nr:hypothetical protein [Halovivax asiaticus]ELZ13438.1 hypothetical protein C479_01296 [Halovivax asiaticus JCM 14624]
MGRYEYDEPTPDPACERCEVGLTADHWVRLEALHQGTNAEYYIDSKKLVCVDCVAAMGMLEFDREAVEQNRSD